MTPFRTAALLAAMLLTAASATAQREQKATAEYTYSYSSDISPKQARQVAEERARLAAINKAFPGQITAEVQTHVETSTDKGESSQFYSSGISEVKGEWLADTKPPQFSDPLYDRESDLWTLTCTVNGRIREVTWSKPEFRWQVLRNLPEAKAEAFEFQDDDQLYMSFEAPCDGYLAVYLSDERGMAQLIVPNDQDPSGIYKVKRGRRYLFFTGTADDSGQMPTEELVTFANGAIEYCQIYVLFSPNRFFTPSASQRQLITVNDEQRHIPGEVAYEDFQKWQLSLLTRDKQLQREKRILTIRSKQPTF